VEDASVRPGIEVLLADSAHIIRGRALGLVTNHTGVTRDGATTADLLAAWPEAELVALFSPEHGIRGSEEAGVVVASSVDARTGLPVHSLYGQTRKPTPDMLKGVEMLVFDIQDVGARYFTYVSTMALAMEAAADAGIPFVVLDRPNPLGGELVQGAVLDTAYASFVGLYPVPARHGMTVGELARLFNERFRIGARLHVVPGAGWRRDSWFDETGLPWVAPSPNMPSLASATHYPGTCLFEGTNLSVGRGTDIPFQVVGAPWLDGSDVAVRLSERGLAGVRFEPVTFTPSAPGDGKFDGQSVQGVQFVVTDRGKYDPVITGVAALLESRRMSGERWEWSSEHFDRLAGTGTLRTDIDSGASLEELTAAWDGEIRRFLELRRPYLIY
jgi:uncharacterized protein YbbC (DUF1343 family)